jgi:hypothetical protein
MLTGQRERKLNEGDLPAVAELDLWPRRRAVLESLATPALTGAA